MTVVEVSSVGFNHLARGYILNFGWVGARVQPDHDGISRLKNLCEALEKLGCLMSMEVAYIHHKLD